MKKRLAISIILFVAIAALIWLRSHRKPGVFSTEITANEASGIPHPQSFAVPSAPVSPNASDPESVAEKVKIYMQHKKIDPIYDWRQPINFYGKVLDDNNQPIPAVSVDYTWSDMSEKGTSKSTTITDAEGLFSIHQTGKRLYMTVSKEGYYSGRDARNATFEYANPADGLFTPDSANPVVFKLRQKRQTERLIQVAKTFRIPRDGSPVDVDLFSGKQVGTGQGQLEIRCPTSDQKNAQNRYDWQCSILIPGGGIMETTNEFPFEAPLDGYQSSIEFDMPKSKESWQRSVEGQYFLKLANGDYANLHFHMMAGGDHFAQVEVVLNPSGLRNLEFDPNNAIQPSQ